MLFEIRVQSPHFQIACRRKSRFFLLVAWYEVNNSEWKLLIGISMFAGKHYRIKADGGSREDPVPRVTFLNTKCKRESKRI